MLEETLAEDGILTAGCDRQEQGERKLWLLVFLGSTFQQNLYAYWSKL